MAKRDSMREWLPLSGAKRNAANLPTGEAYRPEWIDFENGLRIGNLEPHERITQILKFHLEQRYGTRFITDRWGRGVYWQWICWLPRANREAKPVSSDVNFGCAKLFITVDRETRVFKSGLQVERGYATRRGSRTGWVLQNDWDWNRLLEQCRAGSPLDAELHRLLETEGFTAEIGAWEPRKTFSAHNYRSAGQVRRAAAACPKNEWAGFQLYYAMPESEVRGCTGLELVKAMCAVFEQVVPSMNACMQVPLEAARDNPSSARTT
jgi:hypothetical protein